MKARIWRQPASGQVEVSELLDGGAFGSDLSTSFTFTVEENSGGLVLRVKEAGTALRNQTWYAIRNTGGWAGVAPFQVHYLVQVGDANNDGFVSFVDLSFMNTGVGNRSANDDDRRDINGDARVLNSDLSAAWANISSSPDHSSSATP